MAEMMGLDENHLPAAAKRAERKAKRARDLADSKRANALWLQQAVIFCDSLRARALMAGDLGNFLAEDLRVIVWREVGGPKHPNTWGALTSALLRRKMIEANGQFRRMRWQGSHGRMTPAYQWVANAR